MIHQATNVAMTTDTRIGRLLRRTNIDELPQLWNVIVGDMFSCQGQDPMPRHTTPNMRKSSQIMRFATT